MGERSSQAGSDDVEDLRERLSVETALVIVGGADDGLRLSKKKKKAENVTQCMVRAFNFKGDFITFCLRLTGVSWMKCGTSFMGFSQDANPGLCCCVKTFGANINLFSCSQSTSISFMLQSEPTFAVPNQEVGAPR